MSHMYMGFLSPLLNVWNSARETDLLLVLLCTQLFLYISVNLSLFMLCFVLHFSIYFVLLLILWVWGCLSLDIHLWHLYGIFVIWDLPYFGVLYGIPTQFLPSPLLRCIFQQPWFMLPEADTKKKKIKSWILGTLRYFWYSSPSYILEPHMHLYWSSRSSLRWIFWCLLNTCP